MINITLPNNWTPRKDQVPFLKYMWSGGKRAVVVAHRRWGKDDCALHYTATAAMERVGNYWHMLPKFDQARKVIWDAINPKTGLKRIDEAFPKEIRKKPNDTKMMVPFINNASWQLVGSDNFDSSVGSAPIGITFSEYAIANPMAWAMLSPIIEQNNGHAIFIYTPRGNNHGAQLYNMAKNDPDWFSCLITAEDSGVFTKDQLKKIKDEYLMLYGNEIGEALFMQEYYCSFDSAQIGAYYTKPLAQARKDGRITQVPYDSSFPVFTFWDLGIDDSMTIWFIQAIGNKFQVIDYLEGTGEGMGFYAGEMRKKPYVYGDIYLPHDGDHKQLGEVKDTPRETLKKLGFNSVHIVKRPRDTMAVLQGIGAVRNILSRCYFDEKNCKQGLFALESYRADYDNIKKKLGNAPKHDWSSHGADAFRTFAVGYVPPIKPKTFSQIMGYGD